MFRLLHIVLQYQVIVELMPERRSVIVQVMVVDKLLQYVVAILVVARIEFLVLPVFVVQEHWVPAYHKDWSEAVRIEDLVELPELAELSAEYWYPWLTDFAILLSSVAVHSDQLPSCLGNFLFVIAVHFVV